MLRWFARLVFGRGRMPVVVYYETGKNFVTNKGVEISSKQYAEAIANDIAIGKIPVLPMNGGNPYVDVKYWPEP